MRFRKIAKAFLYLPIIIIVLLLLAVLLINTPFGHRFITGKVNTILVNARIPVTINSVGTILPNSVAINGVCIYGKNGDSIVYAENINASIVLSALLHRELILPSAFLHNSSIKLLRESEEVNINIAEAFSNTGGEQGQKENDRKKSWDVSIGSVEISGLKFQMVDSVAGIYIDHEIGSIKASTDEMSIIDNAILIHTLEVTGANGNIKLATKTERTESRDPSQWNFGLANLALKDIHTIFDNAGNRSMINLSISDFSVKGSKSDITKKVFDIRNVSLSGANAMLQSDKKPDKSNEKSPVESISFPWEINCDNLELENLFFGFGDYNDGEVNLEEQAFIINKLDMSLSDLQLDSIKTVAIVNRMNFDLNNGFSVNKINGELDSYAGTMLLSLFVETGNSLVNFDGSYEGGLFDLIGNLDEPGVANASISNSRISLKDLFYFKPELRNQSIIKMLAEKPFSLDGIINLRDSVISLSSVSVSHASDISITLSGEIHNSFWPEKTNGNVQFGIPDINVLWLTEILKEAGFKNDIPDFTTLAMEGTLSESLMSPDFMLSIKSDLGNVDLSGSFDFNEDSFTSVTLFDRIKLDRILNNDELGSFSGSGEITGSGIKNRSITAEAILLIDSLRYKEYDYTRGEIAFKIRPSIYDFRIIFDDPALILDLTAGIKTIDSTLAIHTSGDFMVMGNTLHLLKDTIDVEGNLDAFYKQGINSIDAVVTISNLVVTTPRNKFDAGMLNNSLMSDTSVTSLSGESDFYKLDILIEKPLREFIAMIPDFMNDMKSIPDSLMMHPTIRYSHLPGIHANINVFYHDAFDILLKDLYFKDFDLELNTNSFDERLYCALLGRDIKYKMFELGVLNSQVTDSSGVINIRIEADNNTIFSEPINRLLFTSRSDKWHRIANLSMIDMTDNLVYDFGISSEADSNNLYFKVPSKQLIINGVQWEMDSEELLSFNFDKKRVSPSLLMHTENSSIHLLSEGNGSNNLLKCDLSNVSVTSLLPEMLLENNPTGYISGSASYYSYADSSREIRSDLICRDIRLSDLHFNKLTLNGLYKSEKSGLWTIEGNSRLDSAEITLKGEKPGGGSRTINAEMKKFPIIVAQPFVKKYLSDLNGFLSGNLNISSQNEIENFTGELLITDGNLRINTLNSEYKIPREKILFEGEKLLLDNFTILDTLDNKLFVNGTIGFGDLNSIYADLEVSSSDLQIMNRDIKDNSTFYGKIFVDSRLFVKGPLENPDLQGKIVLTGGTEVFYNKKEDLSLSESEKVITFVSEKSPDDEKSVTLKRELAKSKTLTVKTLVEIDPKTRVNFNLSEKMYVIDLMIQGGGALNYSLLENNQMNLSGRYQIEKGTANVKIIGWPGKQFQIAPDGYIWWDGNMEDPTLKFEALNKVRGSYTNPVDGKVRDVDFNVILKLSERLSELNLAFTISTPDQYLMSIINTLSPEEQMKQAITILLFERIDLPGISTSTDYVTQQVNQILASQLNQLTKTTIKGIDISFGIDSYTSASASGGEQTNTSLSYDVQKALLNDRGKIAISGRVNDYSNPQSNSSLSLNNFSFEYQLDSAATKFVKVYNEHTYEDVFEGEVVKTGIGFIYRKNYKSLGDLWRRTDKKQKSIEKEK